MSSGELRRLGVPALAVEGHEWSCSFAPAALAGTWPRAEIAVVPLAAARVLPFLHPTTRVILEVDWRTADQDVEAASVLSALGRRIAGVVARGPRGAAWADGVLEGAAPVWLVPDPAVRRVEIAAAAVQLGLFRPPEDPAELPEGLALWFSEPGDNVAEEEIEALARLWRSEETSPRLVVAPRFIRDWLVQSGVKAANVEWSPETLQLAFSKAEHCVFVGPEGYSQARRRTLALRCGAPAAAALSPAPSAFEPAQVAAGWEEVLSQVGAGEAARVGRTNTPVRLLAFLDLIQDLDPLLPLLDALRTRPDVHLDVAVTSWASRRSPRVGAELQARGLAYEILDRGAVLEGRGPVLRGVDGVLAAAESSLGAHACTHTLFQRAHEARTPTFAMQHGVENVGLHHVSGEDDASVTADYLFVWFPWDRTPPSVPAALRPRLVHVGRPGPPKPELADLGANFAAFDSVVAVFENLHWSRYDQNWRTRFLADCTEFAFAEPSRAVILKPHHAGLWSVKNRHLIPQWPSNLIVADPTDAFWEPFTAGALVHLADVVITTPSTVALDAVQAGKPVAVGAYGLDLRAYAPLPLLQKAQDWSDFIAQVATVDNARRRATFLARTAVGDRPSERAADYIVSAARQWRERSGEAGKAWSRASNG
ncbi:MAG: hypothetical protein B7Y99_03065 [Caulobacterales bacterium 32-69-10]|nr:MAG: hypothetical protein B7Y99_03065 [Caulobacterales bacterium 32-69-10]